MEKLLEKRAGNMILRIEKDEELEYLVVKSASGQFEMRLRNDTAQHVLVRELMEGDKEDMYGLLSHMWYMVGITIPDGEFIEDVMKALENAEKRFVEGYKIEGEDEDKIIEDMEMAASLEEILSEEDAETE